MHLVLGGDISRLLVANRNKLNMIARDGFMLTQECPPSLWILQQPIFWGGGGGDTGQKGPQCSADGEGTCRSG